MERVGRMLAHQGDMLEFTPCQKAAALNKKDKKDMQGGTQRLLTHHTARHDVFNLSHWQLGGLWSCFGAYSQRG